MKVAGLENCEHFYKSILAENGELDSEKIKGEVVRVAVELVNGDEKIKAILLECSDLPPYAFDIQEAVNLPVFDFTTMINYVFSALIRRRFKGFM